MCAISRIDWFQVLFHDRIINTHLHTYIYLVMTAIMELNDLPTDADPGGGGRDLRKFKDVKEKLSTRGKSARLTAHVQFSTATEGDTERACRKSESDPGAQQSSRIEADDGRASTKCKRQFHHSNSYPDGGAALGRGEGPQMSLCQVLIFFSYIACIHVATV